MSWCSELPKWSTTSAYCTVLRRLEEVGVTLNSGKCEFSKPAIKFLGSLIDAEGIRADLGKTRAIVKMEAPQTYADCWEW